MTVRRIEEEVAGQEQGGLGCPGFAPEVLRFAIPVTGSSENPSLGRSSYSCKDCSYGTSAFYIPQALNSKAEVLRNGGSHERSTKPTVATLRSKIKLPALN